MIWKGQKWLVWGSTISPVAGPSKGGSLGLVDPPFLAKTPLFHCFGVYNHPFWRHLTPFSNFWALRQYKPKILAVNCVQVYDLCLKFLPTDPRKSWNVTGNNNIFVLNVFSGVSDNHNLTDWLPTKFSTKRVGRQNSNGRERQKDLVVILIRSLASIANEK